MDQSYFNHRLFDIAVISIALYSLNIFGELILFLCILASAYSHRLFISQTNGIGQLFFVWANIKD